ncbi:hypothetical protein [Hyphomicrobium sp.]|uniref:hypothetical protein n=1 Tax=Hyphomicrobium sp. TaxID=82 RepID=UPI000F9DF36F|nr:hypothetical protein [Hyphomicrobium sp.]RUO98964.1 MAG: hypothetical protein EKK30_08915 [Hyphomicrobium sp.]
MKFLLAILRIAGWLIAMAIALAASGASIVYAYRYGVTLAASEAEPWMTGTTLAVADVAKVGLPAIIVALWASSHKVTSGALSVVFVMLIFLSLWASASITTIERVTRDAKVNNASKIEADLRAELRAAESRIVELGSPPPLTAIEAEIDGFKTDARWRTTEACNPLNVKPGSRRFCEQAALKQAAREKAAEADGLRVRTNEIRRTLTTPSPDAGRIASPELAVVADVSGWRAESIGLSRAGFFAVALELLGAFAPSAVWFLRPSAGAGSSVPKSAPQPTRVADTSRKQAPRSQSPAPGSRSNVRSQVAGKRGRKRDPNVLDFVREFHERHGRSPNIPEMRAEFPGLHKSTLWRAARVALVGADSPQQLTA